MTIHKTPVIKEAQDRINGISGESLTRLCGDPRQNRDEISDFYICNEWFKKHHQQIVKIIKSTFSDVLKKKCQQQIERIIRGVSNQENEDFEDLPEWYKNNLETIWIALKTDKTDIIFQLYETNIPDEILKKNIILILSAYTFKFPI